jgi:hypothetical protein
MKGGTIRRIANTFRGLVGLPTKNKYETPQLQDPRDRAKKRGSGQRSSRRATRSIGSSAPACRPGTITYHDKLVRHFGRRKADKLGRMMRLQPDLVVTEQDFLDNPPWAFLKERSGNGSTSISSE